VSKRKPENALGCQGVSNPSDDPKNVSLSLYTSTLMHTSTASSTHFFPWFFILWHTKSAKELGVQEKRERVGAPAKQNSHLITNET